MGASSDKIEETLKQVEAAVEALVEGDEWQRWLDTVAKLPRYSLGNQLLIQRQHPGSTMVAGYQRWKAMGRQVRRGEKGSKIIAPRRHSQKVEDEHGNETTVTRLNGFGLATVFDISQTEGRELPTPPLPELLDGEVPHGLWDTLVEHAQEDGWTVEVGPTGDDPAHRPNGWTDHRDKKIVVGDHCPPQQASKTLAHEIAHKLLHADISAADRHTGIPEVEAESVAYSVMKGAGVDSTPYSVPYLAGWSGGDAQKIREVAGNVHSVTQNMLSKVYERIPELDPNTRFEAAVHAEEARARQQPASKRTQAPCL